MQYPASISSEELSQLESVDFDGPIVVVSDLDEDFAEAMDYLKGQTVIGFDTETKPSFTSNSPRHHVALLQLSGRDKAYVFRLNLMGLPAPLVSVLSDSSITKVGAAVKDDVRGLMYYRKFTPRSFVDLQSMVWTCSPWWPSTAYRTRACVRCRPSFWARKSPRPSSFPTGRHLSSPERS